VENISTSDVVGEWRSENVVEFTHFWYLYSIQQEKRGRIGIGREGEYLIQNGIYPLYYLVNED
jgi:hypothetical protein